MARRFPIAELRTLAARALQSGDYAPAASGRVRAVPDTRTIRYYTTLGLIDGPAAMRGRTALYSERHVLQLVAIKRLQAADQTLSDIQERLVGLPTAKLKRLARLPDGFWGSADEYLAGRSGGQPTRSVDLPAAPPAGVAADSVDEFWLRPASLPDASAPHSSLADSAEPIESLIRLTLHPDVQLVCRREDGSASTNSEAALQNMRLQHINLSKIQALAAPLLDELRRQGLIPLLPSEEQP